MTQSNEQVRNKWRQRSKWVMAHLKTRLLNCGVEAKKHCVPMHSVLQKLAQHLILLHARQITAL